MANGRPQPESAFPSYGLMLIISFRPRLHSSSRALASYKNEDPADGDQPILKSVHSEDGQLGFVFQR